MPVMYIFIAAGMSAVLLTVMAVAGVRVARLRPATTFWLAGILLVAVLAIGTGDPSMLDSLAKLAHGLL
ncbi:hypothetical protein [Amycolatopsis orientalis]|uniref:hypothetical protein n=1 Tax=Amycolatopsis orientalis TaxID=31958 RepID=UPI0004078C2D|nr:hypothetical protein [Amycolatopsis orientalis]